MTPIDVDRRARLDALDAAIAADGPSVSLDDERRLLTEALVLPLVDAVVGDPDSTYARFLAVVLASDVVAGSGDEPFTAAYREACTRAVDRLDHLPEAVRWMRIERSVLLLVHSLAAWEHARAVGRAHVDADLLRADLLDTALAVVTAPTSVTGACTGSDATDRADGAPTDSPTGRTTPGPERTLEIAC